MCDSIATLAPASFICVPCLPFLLLTFVFRFSTPKHTLLRSYVATEVRNQHQLHATGNCSTPDAIFLFDLLSKVSGARPTLFDVLVISICWRNRSIAEYHGKPKASRSRQRCTQQRASRTRIRHLLRKWRYVCCPCCFLTRRQLMHSHKLNSIVHRAQCPSLRTFPRLSSPRQ